MRILTCKDLTSLAVQTEALLAELYQQKRRVLRGFFPTGQSPESLYQLLSKKADVWQKKFHLLQIDEFVGPENLFYNILKTKVINPLGLEDQHDAINGSWSESEMRDHIHRVLSIPIDFGLLGLGPNGHIGFHEPDCGDGGFLGGMVKLSQTSFLRVKNAPGHWVLTFGAGSFLRAEKIFLLVVGDEKKAAFENFIKAEPSALVPASLLKVHKDLTVLTTI